MRLLRKEILINFSYLIKDLPGSIGLRLRGIFYAWIFGCNYLTVGLGVEISGFENIQLGNSINIMRLSSLYSHSGKLKIWNNFSMNSNSKLGAADFGEIVIGNNVLMGPNVVLMASNQNLESINLMQ